MICYLQIPIITFYIINSPRVNLFNQQTLMKRGEVKRIILQDKKYPQIEELENFRKWKRAKAEEEAEVKSSE